MIVRVTRPLAARSRAAFTLLEVLVVVAILVILAGVAGIYVFKYLDDAKKGRATMDMQALEMAYDTVTAKNGSPPESMAELTPYLKQGQAALLDPWGNQYQYRNIQSDVGPRVQFFTRSGQGSDGEEIVWPKR